MATSRAARSQATPAARDGFVTYDELTGPDLDTARWSPARLPLPTGGDHTPLDPNAELVVSEGEVRVTIPRFSLSHDTFQPADSAKYLIFSTRQFELSPDRPATFAVDLAVTNIGGQPGDFRRGMAAFHAFDFDASKRVFAVCGTSTRVLALHEQLGAWGAAEPFYHVVEAPYEDFDDDFTRLRACEITLDRSRSTALWRVDDHTVYTTHDTFIPERVRIGFGIWTMLLDPRRSQSLPPRAGHQRTMAPVPHTRDPRLRPEGPPSTGGRTSPARRGFCTLSRRRPPTSSTSSPSIRIGVD